MYKKKYLNFAIFISIIALDQLSKLIILKYFSNLVILNKNGLWGILPAWFSIFGILGLGLFFYYQKKVEPLLLIILAAGISNIIDRLLYNGVVDFITVFKWFPTFNLADVIISSGVIRTIIVETHCNASLPRKCKILK